MKYRRVAERYKKRCTRLVQQQQHACRNSPRKMAQHMLRKKNRSDICKALVFHNVLVAQVRDRYKHADTLRKKLSVASAVSGTLIQKYQLLSFLRKNIGMAHRVARKAVNCSSPAKATRKAVRSGELEYAKVIAFFEHDDVSRMCSGVKQVITKNGVKKQKRILTDNLCSLHRKFVADGNRISYSLFCKLWPFWVVPAQERDGETCLCVLHENIRYLVKAMKVVRLISCTDAEYLVSKFMCSTDSMACAYNECSCCSQSRFQFERLVDDTDSVSFFQWESTKKSYVKDGAAKEVKVTVKARKTVTESEAVALFLRTMLAFKQHSFTYIKQAQTFRECKSEVKANECVVQIDFSENFNCKYHDEVQSVHFGASHEQASLHTVVIYTSGSQPTCLCTVSANLDHGPAGIWAHLKPVLSYIQKNHPDVKHVTFWSDGPTTQYKQKNNFIRLCTEPFEYGFESVSWNYFETGHGKGAVDGVGAAIKRLAHSAARHGKDVNTPQKMFEVVKEASLSVKVFFVTDEEFEASVSRAPSAVAVVKGTRQIHQVTSVLPGTIIHRRLSCFCEWHASGRRLCLCYNRRLLFSQHMRYAGCIQYITIISWIGVVVVLLDLRLYCL